MAEHSLNIDITIRCLEFWRERITMRGERSVLDQTLFFAGLRGRSTTESMALLVTIWSYRATSKLNDQKRGQHGNARSLGILRADLSRQRDAHARGLGLLRRQRLGGWAGRLRAVELAAVSLRSADCAAQLLARCI